MIEALLYAASFFIGTLVGSLAYMIVLSLHCSQQKDTVDLIATIHILRGYENLLERYRLSLKRGSLLAIHYNSMKRKTKKNPAKGVKKKGGEV